MPYHTLIFDLDGTLTDPLTGILRCMNYALSSHNHPVISENELKPYIGPPLEIGLSELSGSNDETHIRELVATYRERYGEFGYAENVVYDGIVDLLSSLQEQGFRMGICTSKFEKYAVKVLQSFELEQYFEFVSGSGKPGLTKADQLQDLLDNAIVTEGSLMIGDRDIDLISAHKTGLHCAGVLWGYGSLQELKEQRPNIIAETPAQLEAAITGKS